MVSAFVSGLSGPGSSPSWGHHHHVVYLSETLNPALLFTQGRVVRKPVNANPGLKVNRGNSFSCIKVLSIAYGLCSLRLLVVKT